MKRLELFEFEDYHWLPNTIRSGLTNLIQVLHRLTGTPEVLSELILQLNAKYPFQQIVDMGSGSGGPMPDTIQRLQEQGEDISLLLTDYHPNPKVVARINDLNSPHLRYHPESVDARAIDRAPAGLKTMVASFHHMPPEAARAILRNAQQSREPILIYEIAENNVPVFLWWMLLPLSLFILIVMSLVMTPFVRPLTLKQLVFTYLIPVIPLIYAWDGQASLMRTYTFADLKTLIGDTDDRVYHWEMETARNATGRKAGYYVMGYPLDSSSQPTP